MKVVLAIFVAFSFLFYTVGFQLFYQMQESTHREYVHQTLSEKKKETIKLSAVEYNLLVDSKNEISWQGNRYDIVAVVPCGDSVLVDGFHDEQEEQIVELFSEFIHLFIKGHNHSNKKSTIIKFQLTDYLPVEKQPFFSLSPVNTKMLCWTGSNYFAITPLPVSGPPPQFFV